ncbi:unnamed protein product [Linum trigynum]|uniref:Uncharacterized protein n=1 Tax=Linum trigynum TaxID=586398 RepID=A0AAV2G911_9ROSI
MKPRNGGVKIRAAVTKSNSNTTEWEMVLAIQVSIDYLEDVRASLRLLVGNRYRRHLELETSLETTSIGAGSSA